MKVPRSCLLAAAVVVAQVQATAQTSAASFSPETSTAANIKYWTRERLAAAKKRWTEDNVKFADCSNQLKGQLKEKRLSVHRQGHFLQDCMNQKR
jgi:hypothetical protein